MRNRNLGQIVTAAAFAMPCQVMAQEDFSVNWHTVDCGGGQSNGEEYILTATIAQPDAGYMSGGESGESFEIVGGYWIDGAAACYANCDGSTGTPALTGNDFVCFINAYANNLSNANCDGSIGIPALTGNDFVCFINSYAAGCT